MSSERSLRPGAQRMECCPGPSPSPVTCMEALGAAGDGACHLGASIGAEQCGWDPLPPCQPTAGGGCPLLICPSPHIVAETDRLCRRTTSTAATELTSHPIGGCLTPVGLVRLGLGALDWRQGGSATEGVGSGGTRAQQQADAAACGAAVLARSVAMARSAIGGYRRQAPCTLWPVPRTGLDDSGSFLGGIRGPACGR